MKTSYIRLYLLATLFVGLGSPCSFAQLGIGTTTPDANAMLDITSSTKGLLLPRLTVAQQTTLAGTLTAAQTGMLVTDAATGKPIVWMGSSWKDAANATYSATAILAMSSTNTLSINPGTAVGDLITWDGNNWVNLQPKINATADNRQPYLAMNYCIALQGIFPSQNTSNPYLGELSLYSFNFPPKGWAMCNGQLLNINQNQALFALLGTTYGGNGTGTFGLPNLEGRVPVHQGSSNGTTSYSIGQTGGTETNTITRQ